MGVGGAGLESELWEWNWMGLVISFVTDPYHGHGRAAACGALFFMVHRVVYRKQGTDRALDKYSIGSLKS